MPDYVPIHQRPNYIEAFEAGRKEGRNPKSGHGMATFFYGKPPEDMPEDEREKLDHMNSAWLTGWFTGSSEWAKENPDPRIVVIDEQKPPKEQPRG